MPFSEPGPIRESSNVKAIDYSTWGQCHLEQVICQKCCDLYFTKKSKMLNSGIRALLFFPGNGDYRKRLMPTFTSAVNLWDGCLVSESSEALGHNFFLLWEED